MREIQNKKGTVLHFLIVDNPDFEYVACLHIPDFNNQNTKQYIEKLEFKKLENFKSDKRIYDYLNSKGNSYQNMIHKLKDRKKFVENKYSIGKKHMEIIVHNTFLVWDNENIKGSNIDEFFNIINW